MAFATKLYVQDDDERRCAERRLIDRPSTLRTDRGRPIDIVVHDLSSSGFRFTSDLPIPVGAIVRVGLSGVGVVEALIVRSDAGDHAGTFAAPVASTKLADAFRGDSVVAFPGDLSIAWDVEETEERPQRWSGAARMLIIVGGSSALWAGIAAATVAWMR